jgi:hypothetical protein
MPTRVLFHDRCFDGACSASLFTRFYRECIDRSATFEYVGLVHKSNLHFDESLFAPGPKNITDNAIVDFKYSASPLVTWWFDHHISAFMSKEDEANFRADRSGKKFFDPNYKSCTKFIADTASAKFGFNAAPVAELIHWADIVDGAQYASAQSAIEMAEPAMKLTLIIESNQDDDFPSKLIPLLTEMPLAKVLEQPFVAERLPALLERHRGSVDIIRKDSEFRDGVIYFDVTAHELEGYNKFVPYYLFPEATYNVGLSKGSFRTKVSVGTNPWTTTPAKDLVNLAAICERYGGGGHARVGAISFAREDADKARECALEVTEELRAATRKLRT